MSSRPESRADARTEFAAALTGIVGLRLLDVCYHVLRRTPAQCSIDELSIEEVELRFATGRVVFVTWGQGRGWPGDCSMVASTHTRGAHADSYLEVAATDEPLWSAHVGQLLCAVEVLGSNRTPHVVRLVFASGAVLVGSGSEDRTYGDGLDVLARPDEPRFCPGFDILWTERRRPPEKAEGQ